MTRSLACLLALVLVSYPAHAVAPLVLIAKEIIQQTIKSFIEDRIADSIRASFGPCKGDLAEDAIQRSRAVTGLLGRGGPGGMGGVGAMNIPNMNVPNIAGALGGGRAAELAGGAAGISDRVAGAASTASAVGNVAGTAGAVAGAAGATGVAGVAGSVAGIAGMGGMGMGAMMPGGADAEALFGRMNRLAQSSAGMPNVATLGATGAAGGGIDPQQMMAQIQQMMGGGGAPLSPAEMNELANTLERFGKVSESIEPGSGGCSADDYRRLFGRLTITSADPRLGPMAAMMSGGVLRSIYTSFQKMEASFVEAEETFNKMSPEDRAEYVDTTVADLKDRSPKEKQMYVAFLDSGLIGAPADMRAALRKRLTE
ncbi:MAG: hypothetical protein ABIU95_15005 [Burkholderiales bacterium]